jgi:type IV pilus assembly protein PilC
MDEREKKDFATTGTESFNLGDQKKQSRVILTIDEESMSEGILLEEKKSKRVITGNPLLDFFNRINEYLVNHSSVKVKDKATFFHLLAVMIDSGIPMVKALSSLVSQMSASQRLQIILEEISSDVESGASLSEALLRHPDVFFEQEVGMIQSGEASGQLSGVLNNLAKDTEKAYQIRSKVKSAMMYPIVVFALLIAVVVGMMVFVIPKLKDLFESNEAELPMVTKIVVAISDFIIEQRVVLVVSVLALFLFFLLFKKTDIGRYLIDQFKIKVPIFGQLFKKAYLSRFARSLSNLLDSNVSIVKAIEITANSVGNEVYKRRLILSMEDVKQGIPLAESLTESDLFPPMLVNMVEVGEKTAQLDEISGKVATFYENEVDTAVSGISKILEPIILIIIGATVGIVVAAIMLPIVQLSNLTETL